MPTGCEFIEVAKGQFMLMCNAAPGNIDRKEPLPLAQIRGLAPISIVVPTYREVANIPHLIMRIKRLREEQQLETELLIMDDDSRDGSAEAVAATGQDWVRIIVRITDRGLSPAVVEGIRAARHPVIVVMDADLSHPPEAIPSMILALDSGKQFVIGSRYVPGGTTDDDWGVLRWLNSRVATLMARPLTNASDPMAGFFAFRKELLTQGAPLNPIGYKIGLELIVKLHVQNLGEVPIHFADRKHGESKLSFAEQLKYVQHLRRLYIYKFAGWSTLIQFLVVGATGTVVNLTVLTLMSIIAFPETLAVATGIGVSVLSNFFLNRRFTFSYARHESISKQFLGFATASAAGIVVNYLTTLWVRNTWTAVPIQAAAGFGILAGMLLNFVANRYLVFKVSRMRSVIKPPFPYV